MLLGSLPIATVENEPQIELLGLFSLGFLRTTAIFGLFAVVYQMGLASNTVFGDAVVCLSRGVGTRPYFTSSDGAAHPGIQG